MGNYILEMEKITKKFPGVKALDNVTFKVRKNEIHALAGENGAGKSTLMKILNGIYHSDSGDIIFEGNKVSINNIKDAKHLGISFIFQENNLIPQLSVAENFYLGDYPKNKIGLVDWKMMCLNAQSAFESLGYSINPKTIVSNLSAADKQMVEIAKAISEEAKIIIMDEPTSSLTDTEAKRFFEIIKKIKKNGTTIIYITHKLNEIFLLANTVSVLRDGLLVSTASIEELTENKIIELMVGRSIDTEYPNRIDVKSNQIILEAKNLYRKNKIYDVSFCLKKGEILGIAGLVGSGRTELAQLLIGEGKLEKGEIFLDGKKVNINSTSKAINLSLGMLTEDRKETGLALSMPVKDNIVISKLEKISNNNMWIKNKDVRIISENYKEKLNIKTPSINQLAYYLSGGNQQKVIIAKWLFSDVDILIFDEPTRGIDVGSKSEIYNLMNDLVENGKSIIFISSELPELLGMSDRILVMHEGRKKGELEREDFSQENIMKLAVS